MVETNLKQCPVCDSLDRESSDGKSLGLDMDFVVRCNECDTFDKAINKKINYLQGRHKTANSKLILERKVKRKLYMEIYYIKVNCII